MAQKNRVDGISLAIVILNVAIVAVIITLVALIYLYMTGRLEDTDVANMDIDAQSSAVMTTTAITTGEAEQITSDTASDDTDLIVSDDESGNVTEEVVYAEDEYDLEFFSNDLFIGDSIYTGLVSYEILPDSQVFAQVGLNPDSALTTADSSGNTAVQKAKTMKPKRIFIMLGSNGIAFLGNNHMADKMKELVEQLKAACPSSMIYIVSIPPVTKELDSQGEMTMTSINEYNKLLKLAAEECSVVYLDLCSTLKDDSGYFNTDYAEADGMHFHRSTYDRMLSFFQRSIKN